MSSRRMTAIIVGGGIAGPAAALALKRVGIDAVVYEGHAQSDNLSGGMSLAPNGMHVLAQLGLADAVLRAGAVMTDACYRNQQGRVLATHPFGRVETYGQPAVGLPRAALHRVLAHGLSDAGIRIHYDKRLVGLTDTPGSPATATFDDGTSAEGDFIIGTDGIHSKTRALILKDAPQPEFIGVLGYGAFVSSDVVSPADPADDGRINMTFGRSGMFGYCKASTYPSRWMWWFNATADEAPSRRAIEAIPTEDLRADLLRQCAGWHDPIEAFITHSESFARVRIFDVPPLPAWSSGRALLMGDAAHAMSPASGQGASTALEDAVYLAHLLRVPETPLADVFDRFVRERQPRVEKINAEARRTSSRKKPMGPVGAWMRDRMFSLLLPRMALRSFDWKFRYRVPFEA